MKKFAMCLLLVIGICGCQNHNTGGSGSKGQDDGANEKASIGSPLKKSALTEKELENLSVWRFYSKDTEPYADSASRIVAFSNDGRIQMEIALSKGPMDNYNLCSFTVVGKVKSTSGGDEAENMLLDPDSLEFIFSDGKNEKKEGAADFNSLTPGGKQAAEAACFRLFSLADFASFIAPSEYYPKVAYGNILARSDKSITFGVHAPSSGGKKDLPAGYTYSRLKPSAWEFEQKCRLPHSSCLP